MGLEVGQAHLRHLNPFPKNLGEILKKYERVIIPEMNSGQLIKIIRDQFLIDAHGVNKVKGIPFSTQEIVDAITQNIPVK